MSRLTIFTPTYNRRNLLERSYLALKKQSSDDFEWLIIDDGSDDGTEEAVSEWLAQENKFRIRYIWKENGGLHTAYNTAIMNLTTELAMCVDSDDYLPENAVERILQVWDKEGSRQYAGIIGLDFDPAGHVIGDYLPEQKTLNLIDVAVGKYYIRWGDRKLVVRSELYKEAGPMKVFSGEKYFNPNYLHMEISKKYDFLVLNENLCNVDYQQSGMSSNIWKQYYNSPRSFAELRKQHLGFSGSTLRYRYKEYIHYISSTILAGRDCGLENKNLLLYYSAYPLGFLLSRYVILKNLKIRG